MVGAGLDDDAALNAGAAFVFRHIGEGWVEEAKLIPNDAAEDDVVGYAVAAEDNRVVIGVQPSVVDGRHGKAYVFEYISGVWIETTKLSPSASPLDSDFGSTVATDGEYVVVGAPSEFSVASIGLVYIYQRVDDDWVENSRFGASDNEEGYQDAFGNAVDIDGDTVLAGSVGDEDVPEGTGSVYVFSRVDDAWLESQVLTRDDPNAHPSDSFGFSVAIDDDWAVIGASNHASTPSSPGAAYVFHREDGQWHQYMKLDPGDLEVADRYGQSVAIHGYRILVGARGDDDNGAVHVFEFNGLEWVRTVKLIRTGVSSVSVYGVGGAYGTGGEHGLEELAYLVDLSSSELLADCDGDGVPDECQDMAIVSSDPPHLALDARQPSEPDGSVPAGWQAVDLTFSDTGVCTLTPQHFSVNEVGGDNVPPAIASVEQTGPESVRVTLAEAIQPGAWTVIRHRRSGTGVRLGYLPADVNGDATSSAADVLALIDSLNGLTALPDYATDTDRSGSTTSADLLRLIDLLNGASAFDPWIGVSLPCCPD